MQFWQSSFQCEGDQLFDVAKHCEKVGFHGFLLPDHLVHPEKQDSKYLYSADNKPPQFREDTLWPEAWSLIGGLAAITEKLHFCTNIYILPLRHPLEVAKATGDTVTPEVMIPLIAMKAELDLLKGKIEGVHKAVEAETGAKIAYLLGTMIELPRAALRAAEIAESAEFFSFGTNDLTQTTYGISRDDSARFLTEYQRLGLMDGDPFVSLDQSGVGELIEIATERGRKTRPNIKLGICGEHGGDPASIRFCAASGLDYVSCSPYRVPIARLAAAQAALAPGKDRREDR